MNDLNCERPTKTKKTLIACTITAIVSIILTAAVFLFIFCRVPGVRDLIKLDSLINKYHLSDQDDGKINDGILEGYIFGLDDKYAAYYNSDDSTDRNNNLNGLSSGIGVNVVRHPDNGFLYIYHVFKDSPADVAGLKEGDMISRVDDKSVVDEGFVNSVNLIGKDEGNSVSLTVIRGETELDLDIVIRSYTIQTVFYQKIEDFGYVEITSFNSETVAQFNEAITSLTALGIDGLIFDLRGNGGGTVNSVCSILDTLVPEGNIMTVKYKDGNEVLVSYSDEKEIDLPMAVLTDSNTASASELFAATIRDFNKGVLVGEKTFGKGVMQNTFDLSGGRTVVFTVAEFFSHSKVSFNDIGLIPDIEVDSDIDDFDRYFVSPAEDKVVNAALSWLSGD